MDQSHKLMRLTNFSTSVDLSLSDLLKKNKNKNGTGSNTSQNSTYQVCREAQECRLRISEQATTGAAGPKDAYGYPVFDMPWTFI